MKGDNEDNISTQTNDIPSLQPSVSRSGRPLHRTMVKPTYMESDAADSSSDDEVLKVDNKRNLSKPSSSGPSTSRIAAQKRRMVSPRLGVKPKRVYKWSASPTYSISSSGASTFRSQHSDNDSDSDVTFDGFEPLSQDDQNKLSKLEVRNHKIWTEKEKAHKVLHLPWRRMYIRWKRYAGTERTSH